MSRSRPARTSGPPRVTLGVATYQRDAFLQEALTSALAQDYSDYEVLVVEDGTTNPAIASILAGFQDERLRVVRHERNLGIAESYNTIVREGRGELIAMLGDDDVCLPDRLSRQVSLFDAHPETGVVHGDALIIDAEGRPQGSWSSIDQFPAELRRTLVREHNFIVDPTRMVHRRVYEAVGGYDPSFELAQDFDFWLRAAARFRFRHCPGGPLIQLRRHGDNGSDQSMRGHEIADLQNALRGEVERAGLRELVPELDWAVLDPVDAERQALEVLAQIMEQRHLPLPELAAELRQKARSCPPPARRPHNGRRLMIAAYGWNASGGGTTVPRLLAKELARCGWEVTVFYAAATPSPSGAPYELIESEQDGVRLLGVYNRPHHIMDLGNPLREIADPPITRAFASALDRFRPDAIHFYNLHNLGGALMAETAARGLRAFFTPNNYWLICPQAYLITGEGDPCAGPGDGARCAACVGSGAATAEHRLRLELLRAHARGSLEAILAPSWALRQTLCSAGYPGEMIAVVRQSMPHFQEIWERTGRERPPGRRGGRLNIAFIGSGEWHKGPQQLIAAAQRCEAEVQVSIHGRLSDRAAAELAALDRCGVAELCGPYATSELPQLLAQADAAALPSQWWDCAPLAAGECLAARLPLLAPRLGGLEEAIEEEVDGLHFDAFSHEDLAAKIDRLAGEAGLLERLQAGIRQPRAFAEYVEELESLYAGRRLGTVAPPAHLRRRPAVRWASEFGATNSLSKVSERLCERIDADIQRVDHDGRALDGALSRGAEVEVRHLWPPSFAAPQATRLALIQPWEFGALPLEWIEPLRSSVDELWVPSEHVRQMYLAAGIDPERVICIPNGVDLDCYRPEGERYKLKDARVSLRLLFVGALIARKGPDILLASYIEAFPGREDVLLVVKTGGASGIYDEAGYEAIAEHARRRALPRVQLIDRSFSEQQMASLYRACDVLVHPARGEGFALPVLEAMACGLPVVHTAGTAMDEFCPPRAGWRIAAERFQWAGEAIGALITAGRPELMEPDILDLARILRRLPEQAEGIRQAGKAAREAALAYGWEQIAARYSERLQALAGCTRAATGARSGVADRRPVAPGNADGYGRREELRILATPAWRGEDRLAELLAEWAAHSVPGCGVTLCLVADPAVDGSPQELEQRLLTSGIDFESIGDVNLLVEAQTDERDLRHHRAVDAYVPLHRACGGHLRMAAAAGNAILEPGSGAIARLLAQRSDGAEAPAPEAERLGASGAAQPSSA